MCETAEVLSAVGVIAATWSVVIGLLSHSGRRTALGTDWTRKPSSCRRREQPCQPSAAGGEADQLPGQW